MTAIEQLRVIFTSALRAPELGASVQPLIDMFEEAIREAQIAGMRRVAYQVPHQLGGPLSEVRGYAELLLDADYTVDERRDMIARIHDASIRAAMVLQAVTRIAEAGA